MKFLTFAFVINFILVCWPKLDIITNYLYFEETYTSTYIK